METMIIMMIIMSTLFLNLMTPLSMVIMLIMQTLVISIISSIMISSFWYSYMLILIMISGLLILFMYMASIASNEKFYMSNKLILYMILMSLYLKYMMPKTIYEMKISSMINQEMIMSKLFNYKFITPTILMMLLLFMMMVTISFLVSSNEGPMRKSN
uniref:NADH dehydrogenase subunit 6 n=1 Tax=Stephanitis pyrioides TaxID=369450 RepID=UPI002E7A624A|nr:NADH dehydrogenase subunit 6 [Stephanitis pyrioides]WQM87491.1 NADH dehydrogenase subunit 6 [Stephanitis pyrioides]